jgi:hypothetical protein
VSALEQEPVLVTGVALTAATPALLAGLLVPGQNANYSLSNPQSQNNPALISCPFKIVRVRGIAWVTGTASILTLTLLRGVGTGGAQVLQALVQAGAAAVGVPVPFEFVDIAPTGLNYTLVANASVTTVASAIANISGFDA